MIVTIHQPEHLPWLGYIDKAFKADVFVLLDNVQFRKNYFQNRNKVRTASGSTWLTVPLKKHGLDRLINEIEINNLLDWRGKAWKTLMHNYSKAPCFSLYGDFFETLYTSEKAWSLLSEFNAGIIRFLFREFGVETELLVASDISDKGLKRGDLIVDICKSLGASEYISGIYGKKYLDLRIFQKEGIQVSFHEFYHPVYEQCYKPFEPCMSSIDLLFNHGKKSKDILLGAETPRLDHLFA